jgi:fido (protein-threonine AMPylation protein)
VNCPAGQIPTPAQGKQPVTRYQFAAGLDACLNQITQPLQQGNFATKTELNQLTQRQQELNQEIRQLRDRVDASDPPPGKVHP